MRRCWMSPFARAREPGGRAQRMCLAQVGPLQYMVLCCRWGLDLVTLRDLAMSLADCRTVYTLDRRQLHLDDLSGDQDQQREE